VRLLPRRPAAGPAQLAAAGRERPPTAPPHDPTGHTRHHDDDTLLAIVRVGTRAFTGRDLPTDMGGFADRLSEREIAASIAFITSTWPAAVRARQAEITARAQAERRKP